MVFVLLGVLLVFEKVSVIKIEKDLVIIEWIKLVLDGGFRICKYIIYKRIEMIDKWIKVILVEQFIIKVVIEKLEFEKNYFFVVFVENDIGESDKVEIF